MNVAQYVHAPQVMKMCLVLHPADDNQDLDKYDFEFKESILTCGQLACISLSACKHLNSELAGYLESQMYSQRK